MKGWDNVTWRYDNDMINDTVIWMTAHQNSNMKIALIEKKLCLPKFFGNFKI